MYHRYIDITPRSSAAGSPDPARSSCGSVPLLRQPTYY